MLDVLYKKAKGYEVVETTKEYGVDEEGNTKLVKEKTSTKFIPPDLAAIKTYMELKSAELYHLSDAELEKEKQTLLRALKKSDRKKKGEL